MKKSPSVFSLISVYLPLFQEAEGFCSPILQLRSVRVLSRNFPRTAMPKNTQEVHPCVSTAHG
jgi:hypothetical protein